jgi:flagellar motor protein MotB
MMFRKRAATDLKKSGEEENPFLLSFSDLMASLLAIFILALVVMMIQLHNDRQKVQISIIKLKESLAEIQQAQNAVASALEGVGLREKSLRGMLEEIQRDLKEQGVEVMVSDTGLHVQEKGLSFELNRFEIQDRYKPAADLIGAALLNALRNETNRKILDTVFIEGHTDSVPNRREMGNWGLSTYRAISLWLYWTETPGTYAELKDLKSLAQEEERPLISISGYADTRPLGFENAIPKPSVEIGNPADRRIDIRFTLASQEKKDLSELQEPFQKMRSETDNLIKMLEGI